jgi:hypothetical protein
MCKLTLPLVKSTPNSDMPGKNIPLLVLSNNVCTVLALCSPTPKIIWKFSFGCEKLFLFFWCKTHCLGICEMIFLNHTCRFIEFGNNGGPAAKALKPKFNLFVNHLSKNTGLMLPHIDVGMLLLFYCHFLVSSFRIHCVWFWYFICLQIETVIAATMFLKGFGGLLFILSSSFGAFLLVRTEQLSTQYCSVLCWHHAYKLRDLYEERCL